MSTLYWCRGCGWEDNREHSSCGACGSPLTTADLELLKEDEMGEETVYELETTPLQRAGLVEALVEENIRHRWDTITELVVATSVEDAVDKIIEDVLHEETEVVNDDEEADPSEVPTNEILDEDADPDNDALVDDGDGEQYEAMSQLFFSADRLLKKWDNNDVGTFIADATSITMMLPPYGVEDESWADLQALAKNTAMSLQENAEADVEAEVTDLRDRLKSLI